MADERLTDQPDLPTPDGADVVHVVDVSDTTSNPAGTSKKATITNVGSTIIAGENTDNLSEGSTNLYNRVPTGGGTGTVLTKNSATDFDASFIASVGLPAGGATNNILAKNSGTDFDADFTGDGQLDSLGIGGAPATTAALDVQSTTQSIIVPRMTNAQKEAITSPPDGSLVYDTTQGALNYRNNGVWDGRQVLDGQSIITPLHPGIGTADTGVAGDATLKGGLYKTPQVIKFNRLYMDVSTYSGGAPITARFLIYQDQDGDGTPELICTIEDFDPGSTGVAIATPTENPVVLLPGNLIVLWGEDGSGNISLVCHTVAQITLYNSSTALATGQIPTTFNTTISSTTSPATIDPTVGGTDGFVGADAADTMPVIRFNLV